MPKLEEKALASRTGDSNAKGHRKVPMEVLCFGLPRTGTLSVRAALCQLGYNDTYHMEVCIAHPDHPKKWLDIYRAKLSGDGKMPTREQWDELLGDCMAVTDVPCANFWRELLEAYPEAKVILLTRSPDAWHKSVSNTIWQFSEKLCAPTDNIWEKFIRLFRGGTMNEFIVHMINATFGLDFAKNGRQRFIDHNEAVRKAVAKDKLLEFNVKDGWEPLCKFLDKSVPETPFPRTNDTADFQKRFSIPKLMLDVIPALKMAVMVGVLSGLTYAAQKYWRWR